MAAKKGITSMRECVELLKDWDELYTVTGEVDPIYEISGIQKQLDDGPAFLFDKVKGYPNVRVLGGVFARTDRSARLFGLSEWKNLKFKCLEAVKKPIPPKIVDSAPCQEVVITKNIDAMALLPVLKYTESDGARIMGSGVQLISGKYFDGGSHLGWHRMSFRGKDWSTIQFIPGAHGDAIVQKYRSLRENVPLTVNITPSPAVSLVGAGQLFNQLFPPPLDEVGIAGALQGSPVELVKAKTVDAYAVADSEWVIEGYVDVTAPRIWETEGAEKLGEQGEAPFFPEWTGYLGRAYKTLKFQVTAITHRKDRPIYYAPMVRALEQEGLCLAFNHASWYEMAQRVYPGLVVDVNHPHGFPTASSIVFQIKKRWARDEGFQRNILAAAMGAQSGMRLVVIVDDDVNIYDGNDVFWAVITRADLDSNLVRGIGGRGQPFQPLERVAAARGGITAGPRSKFEGGLGIDATVPFDARSAFTRPHYPVEIDLKKWFSEEEIRKVRVQQSDFAKYLAATGR